MARGGAEGALDRAVWAAYGWDDEPTEAEEDAILSRLLALNLERAASPSDVRRAIAERRT